MDSKGSNCIHQSVDPTIVEFKIPRPSTDYGRPALKAKGLDNRKQSSSFNRKLSLPTDQYEKPRKSRVSVSMAVLVITSAIKIRCGGERFSDAYKSITDQYSDDKSCLTTIIKRYMSLRFM